MVLKVFSWNLLDLRSWNEQSHTLSHLTNALMFYLNTKWSWHRHSRLVGWHVAPCSLLYLSRFRSFASVPSNFAHLRIIVFAWIINILTFRFTTYTDWGVPQGRAGEGKQQRFTTILLGWMLTGWWHIWVLRSICTPTSWNTIWRFLL